jgi:hypothetical protein
LTGIRSSIGDQLHKRIFEIDRSRKVECPFADCRLSIPISELVDHYFAEVSGRDCCLPCLFDPISRSGIKSMSVDASTFQTDWVRHPGLLRFPSGDDFFLANGRKNGIWNFWVIYIGSPKQAEYFESEIRIYRESDESGSEGLVRVCPVVSVEVPVQNMSNPARDISGPIRNIPGLIRDVSGSIRDVPGSIRDLSCLGFGAAFEDREVEPFWDRSEDVIVWEARIKEKNFK